MVRAVGDRFLVEVLLELPRGASNSNNSPDDVFLILVAPSFARYSTGSVYSYHPLRWSPVSAEKKEDLQKLQAQLEQRQQNQVLIRRAASFREDSSGKVFAAGVAPSPQKNSFLSASSNRRTDDSHLATETDKTSSASASLQQTSESSLWLGQVDFGFFTRCGFYDWRICRAQEDAGTW